MAEINKAGVELARRVVAASFKDVFVAGDVGPLGVRIAPYGRVSLEEARAAFAEQISALAEAGADLIVIETVSDLYEIREAVRAAREMCCRSALPWWPRSRSRAMTAPCWATTRPRWRARWPKKART